jgi:hypothetical protein
MPEMHWWQMIATSAHHRPQPVRSDLAELIKEMPASQVDPAVKAYRLKRRKAHRVARTQRMINRKRAA